MEVTIKKTEPFTVAFISVKGPFSLINDSFGKLFAFIGEQGFIPAGPPSGLYFNSPAQVAEDELLWELRVPIAGTCDPSGPDERGLGFKNIGEAAVAAVIHRGPFNNIAETYQGLGAWIEGNGYEIAGPCEEVYLTEPGNTPPAELMTEIRFPVVKRR